MDNKTSNIELIDKFIDNERRSKMWTIISVSLFLLMAALVLLFAFKLQSANKKLDVAESDLEKAYAKQDSLISILQQRAISTDRNSDNLASRYDSLKQAFDVMALLFNKSQTDYYKNNKAEANQQLDKLTAEVVPKQDAKLIQNVKQAILDPKKIEKTTGDFLVFLQCMPAFKDKAANLEPLLKSKKYRTQPVQVINDFTFDPGVKYFHDDDMQAANDIAAIVNSSDPYFKQHPAKAVKLSMKSSYHQIEVWIGAYQQQDAQQFLKKAF